MASTGIREFVGITADPMLTARIEGEINGKAFLWRKVLGRRDKGWVDTSALGDIANYLGTTQSAMNVPTLGTEYFLSSDSANDASAGSGARTVQICYLNTAGAEVTKTISMVASTATSAGTDIDFVQNMEVLTLGSTVTSAGNISLSGAATAASVTSANTYHYINAGSNRSLVGAYKVPTGYTGYVYDTHASGIGTSMDVRAACGHRLC